MQNDEHSNYYEEIVTTLESHNYELKEKIGSGGYASVFKCRQVKYKEIFCVKIIELQEDSSGNLAISFLSEIQTLVKIIHPNIITIFDHFQSKHCFYLILEYCPNGSLFDLISQKGQISKEKLVDLYKQILQATNYIHSIGIAHRDIKPRNILFDMHNRPKLADFGLAEFYKTNQKEREKFGGSLPYMAPELVMIQEFNPEAVDVWALGISFYEMATGSLPWASSQVKTEILSGFICFPNDLDEQITFLIKKMLQHDPERRPSCKQLLDFPIFNEMKQHSSPSMHLKQMSFLLPMSSFKQGKVGSSQSWNSNVRKKRKIVSHGSSIYCKKRVALTFTFDEDESLKSSDND